MGSVGSMVIGSLLIAAGIFLAYEAAHPAKSTVLAPEEKSVMFVVWIIAGVMITCGSVLVIQEFMR
jgi:hypothetical protein